MRIKNRVLLLLSVILLFGCQRNESDSDLDWWMGAKISEVHEAPFLGFIPPPDMVLPRGHEEITYQAILRANEMIDDADAADDSDHVWHRFQTLDANETGTETTNMLMLGNFAADVPESIAPRVSNDEQRDMIKAYKFILNVPDEEDLNWHDDPRLQMIHFMSSSTQSKQQACEQGREHIGFLTMRSTLLWAQAHDSMLRESLNITDDPELLKERAVFWAGVATHVIQDSFSPAHVKRTANARRNISDICIYKTDVEGRCDHSGVDTDDIVWKYGLLSYLTGHGDPNNPDERFYSLKDEAKDAVLATANYLRRLSFLYKIASVPASPVGIWVDNQMFDFFHIWKEFNEENAISEGSGWFRCQDQNISLAGQVVPGVPDLWPSRENVIGGDSVFVEFGETQDLGDKAYIGLTPHSTPNQSMPLQDNNEPPEGIESWIVINSLQSNKANFTIKGAGKWDFRLYNSQGEELKVRTINSEPKVSVSENNVLPEQSIVFSVSTDPTWDANAFVTVVKSDTEFSASASWNESLGRELLDKRSSLSINFNAPQMPGNYQLRLFDGPSESSASKLRAIAPFVVRSE